MPYPGSRASDSPEHCTWQGVSRTLEALATAASVPALLGLLAAHAARRPELGSRVLAAFEASTALGLIAGSLLGTALWDPLGR